MLVGRRHRLQQLRDRLLSVAFGRQLLADPALQVGLVLGLGQALDEVRLLAQALADDRQVLGGVSTGPKWVRPSRVGSQLSTIPIESIQASTSMSGGGVGA